MKSSKRQWVVAVGMWLAAGLPAWAAVPDAINFQGFLTNPATGQPVTTTVGSPLTVSFTLYDALTAGNLVYSELQSVSVTSGVFNVQLGTGTAQPGSAAFAAVAFDRPYWLEIAIGTGGGAQTLAPRQPLASAPTALRAAVAEALPATPSSCGAGTFATGIDVHGNASGCGAPLQAVPGTGTLNVAVGSSTLLVNTTGQFNSAIGDNVLQANTTGQENAAGGYLAMQNNTTGSYNTAFGPQALRNNQGGNDNTAVGIAALVSNTTGSFNAAFGASALASSTSASDNVALGALALELDSTGANNTAAGTAALNGNTLGSDNTALGLQALAANTTANKNTAVGSNALAVQSFSNGNVAWDADNTAVGYEALYANQPAQVGASGNDNTAVGALALQANSSGFANTALGHDALLLNTTGWNNTAAGQDAMHFNGIGAYNSGLGQAALYSMTSGNSNTGVGVNTLFNLTSGSDNTALGYQAGYHATGSNNIMVGAQAGFNASTGNYNIIIGQVGLSTDSGVVRIGDGGVNHTVTYLSGAVYGQSFNTTSDASQKADFHTVDPLAVLQQLGAMPMSTWRFRSDTSGARHIGPTAQDFMAAFRVGNDDRHIATVDESGVALAAIQGLYHLVQDSEAALKARDSEIAELRAQLQALRKELGLH